MGKAYTWGTGMRKNWFKTNILPPPPPMDCCNQPYGETVKNPGKVHAVEIILVVGACQEPVKEGGAEFYNCMV